MKSILSTAVIALLVVLGFQTQESARAHRVSFTCGATEVENAACVSFGPLGAVNSSSIRFWITEFIDHGVELPNTIQNLVREGAGGQWF